MEEHIIRLDDLRHIMSRYILEQVEEITSMPRKQLQEATQLINTTPSLLSTAL